MGQFKCLPKPFDENCEIEEVYKYFLKEMFYYNLRYNGTLIKFFGTPVVDNKLQGFHHIATKEAKDYKIKIRMKDERARYIGLIIPVIENSIKCKQCEESGCKKIKTWVAPYKDKKRVKFLVEGVDFNYLIIMEQKERSVYYIISAFLIDSANEYLINIIKEYNKYKKTL